MNNREKVADFVYSHPADCSQSISSHSIEWQRMFVSLVSRKSDTVVKMQKVKSVISFVLALMVISVQLLNVSARHVPYSLQQDDSMISTRRQDFDDEDDELDSNASAPYQNQDNNGNANGGDGYEETEPDGPYEETPREQEGQADMERFFDDHLGASDRDGMDKENLPSNLVPLVMEAPDKEMASTASMYNPRIAHEFRGFNRTRGTNNIQQFHSRPTVGSDYLQLPDDELIITPHAARDTNPIHTSTTRHLTGRLVAPSHAVNPNMTGLGSKGSRDGDGLDAKDSRQRVVATEDDEFDRVYVTHITDEPFKIAALGGFDPEQDFIDATRDIDEPERESTGRSSAERTRDFRVRRRLGSKHQSSPIKEDDGDMETMFEGASETDEITFDHEDPFQTDLEAEMRHQAFDKVNVFNVDPKNSGMQALDRRVNRPIDALTKVRDSGHQNIDDDDTESRKTNSFNRDRGNGRQHENIHYQQEPMATEQNQRSGLGSILANSEGAEDSDDDDEGKWAHDGIEDMEIPTEARQNQVLNRAAKYDQLARQQTPSSAELDEVELPASKRVANDATHLSKADDTNEDDNYPASGRMPNADYLKEDIDS